jgi:CarboxypepD_reg-like domain
MKKIVLLSISLVLIASVGFAGTALGASNSYEGPATLATSGSIRGVVLCGETGTTPVPREWATVWVQGMSFSARTDDQGRFRIDYVPRGSYVLGVQTAGMPIRGEFDVTVRGLKVIDVGDLVVHGGCGACGGGGEDGGCSDGGDCSDGGGEDGGCTDGTCGG